MNPYTNLPITALWLLCVGAELWLASRTLRNSRSRLFMSYAVAMTVRSLALVTWSFLLWPEGYWYTFWIGQVVLHGLAFTFIAKYALDALRLGLSLPESAPANAALAMAGIICASILVRYWSATATASTIRFLEMGCATWIAGFAWIVLVAFNRKFVRSQAEDILIGFVVLYSASVITSAVWAYFPQPQPRVWIVEFAAQLAAIGWWIHSIRVYSLKYRKAANGR